MFNQDFAYYQKALQKLTNHAKNSLSQAELLAREFGEIEIRNIHLLFAVFLEKGSLGEKILTDLNLNKNAFLPILRETIPVKSIQAAKAPFFSEELKKTIIKAFNAAKKFSYPYVGTEHLVYAIISLPDQATKKVLAKSKIKNLPQSLGSVFEPLNLSGLSRFPGLPEALFPRVKSDKSSLTPFIDKFCLNVNEDVKKKDETIIGREKELERIINILGRKNKNNPLLLGEPGVGKTALIGGLARILNSGEVPAFLYGKKIMSLDIAGLIAGTSFRGEFELRLKEIIKEAGLNKNIIIFIDELHTIIGAGNLSGSLDLANIIKPALARGEIQVIGATTSAEYKKHIEKDAALERRFQPIQIKESTPKETLEILLGIKKHYEKFHNISISDEAIALAVELSSRYIQNRFLPDKAIDTLDEAASNVRSKNKISDFMKEIQDTENRKKSLLEEKEKLVLEEKYEAAIEIKNKEKELDKKLAELQAKQVHSEKENPIKIKSSDILETVSKISGIPVSKLSQEKNLRLKNIQNILSSQIIGQTEAIKKLTDALFRSQSGISSPDRPLGSFIFLGPTGVGKTLTAKILAQEFFGQDGSLIKIDMSELMERHSIASLIGSPAGYIGYGEGGNLTEKVRRNPYSVILFDEIEKAHPDVFNILLQILEDGILTDAEGTKVSFKNTIVIMTSNIGTEDFTHAFKKIGFERKDSQKEISRQFDKIKEAVLGELKNKMKPELLNRLDYILVFNALGREDIKKIALLELKKLSDRLSEQKISLSFGKNVVDFLAQKSLAENQGARLVRKNIQDLVENKIAEMIVYDKVKKGKISLNITNKQITIR